MAGYLLYLPGALTCEVSHLESRGLGELCRDCGPDWSDVFAGPDGGRGKLLGWRTGDMKTDPAMTLDLETQNWIPAPPNPELDLPEGHFWLGLDKERPLQPQDIKRRKQIRGRPVMLADGQAWLVPIAVCLPHRHGLDPRTGFYSRRVDSRYQRFVEMSQSYAQTLLRELDAVDTLNKLDKPHAPHETLVEVPLNETWDYLCLALSINYRLAPPIISLLELVDDGAMVATVCATIEFPEIQQVRDHQKKTARSPVAIPVT